MKLFVSIGLLCVTQLVGQPPKISYVTNAGFFAGNYVADGSFVSIYGDRLAQSTASATIVPLPKFLGGTFVSVCGSGSSPGCINQELLFVSPTQINFRVALDSRHFLPRVVVNRNGEQDEDFTRGNVGYPVRIYPAGTAPGIFASGFDCPVATTAVPCGLTQSRQHPDQIMRPMITDANYKPISSQNPAVPGVPFVIWLTGLGFPGVSGNLNERLNVGLSYAFPIAGTSNRGSIAATVYFAGAVAGFPGLYQINAMIPSTVAKLAASCGTAREGVLKTDNIEMPLPIRASPESEACR